jgi:hypothetical protein
VSGASPIIFIFPHSWWSSAELIQLFECAENYFDPEALTSAAAKGRSGTVPPLPYF